LGVVTLRELLSNEIFTPLERIMTTRLISVKLDDDDHVLVDLFAKYGFRAIPVVDDNGKLIGVVRYKTILDIMAPRLGR
jgi:magnesium transporter